MTSNLAQLRCEARGLAPRRTPKLHADGVLFQVVRHQLNLLWSPQQIARTRRLLWPDNPEKSVSHETIYNAIYLHPRGELKRELIACLRHHNQARKPRSRGADRSSQIPDMHSIHIRPPEIADRLIPGHWEGDLIKGPGNRSLLGTLVERFNGRISEIVGQTRFACAAELESTLRNYLRVYSHSIPQRALKHLMPIQALKEWQHKKPELFVKRVYNQEGLDRTPSCLIVN